MREYLCHAPLYEECQQHLGHKEYTWVAPKICGAIGEMAQAILVWMKAQALGIPLIYAD